MDSNRLAMILLALAVAAVLIWALYPSPATPPTSPPPATTAPKK
jgi:hypothetical protein